MSSGAGKLKLRTYCRARVGSRILGLCNTYFLESQAEGLCNDSYPGGSQFNPRPVAGQSDTGTVLSPRTSSSSPPDTPSVTFQRYSILIRHRRHITSANDEDL
jgi:hypothetical protein